MGFTTMASINTNIASVVSGADLLKETQDYDSLSEAIVNWPLAQVYWEEDEFDTTTDNQQTSFGGAIRQYNMIFNVDVYVCPTAHKQFLYTRLYPIKDQLDAIFANQIAQPFFGVDGIKSFQVNASKGVFAYANDEFFGLRYQITLRLF